MVFCSLLFVVVAVVAVHVVCACWTNRWGFVFSCSLFVVVLLPLFLLLSASILTLAIALVGSVGGWVGRRTSGQDGWVGE